MSITIYLLPMLTTYYLKPGISLVLHLTNEVCLTVRFIEGPCLATDVFSV